MEGSLRDQNLPEEHKARGSPRSGPSLRAQVLGLARLNVFSNVHMMARKLKSFLFIALSPLVPDSGYEAPEGTDSVPPGFHDSQSFREARRGQGGDWSCQSLPMLRAFSLHL